MQNCQAICLAQSFKFNSLKEKLLENTRAQLFRNTIIVEYKFGYSIIFAYGVVVYWNVDLDERRKMHDLLFQYSIEPDTEPQEDSLNFQTGCEQDRVQSDLIELKIADYKVFLALSHAMAQSIKLAVFERDALETIHKTRHLPESLAREGKIPLNRIDLAKIRGQLFITKSGITLNYDLLDIPEFFWEYPEYQGIYSMAANYLELQPRTDVLSKKLETIHELLEMLDDEQKHQHSSTLEWIIIWLIAVEIVMSITEKLL